MPEVRHDEFGEQLHQIVAVRAVIEQAKGILMAAQHCDAEEAFDLLVRASQRENVKVRDIAVRIVAGTTEPATPVEG